MPIDETDMKNITTELTNFAKYGGDFFKSLAPDTSFFDQLSDKFSTETNFTSEVNHRPAARQRTVCTP